MSKGFSSVPILLFFVTLFALSPVPFPFPFPFPPPLEFALASLRILPAPGGSKFFLHLQQATEKELTLEGRRLTSSQLGGLNSIEDLQSTYGQVTEMYASLGRDGNINEAIISVEMEIGWDWRLLSCERRDWSKRNDIDNSFHFSWQHNHVSTQCRHKSWSRLKIIKTKNW